MKPMPSRFRLRSTARSLQRGFMSCGPTLLTPPSGGGGGFAAPTFHDSAKSGTDNSSGTSTATADTLAVTAGDLIVVICKWEQALAGSTVTVADGTDTYSAATTAQAHTNNDLNMQMFWTVATTTGTRTITSTHSAARTFRRIAAMSFTKGAGATGWALGNTVQGTNGNSNASPTAGSLSATTSCVAIMGSGLYGDRTLTAGTGWTTQAEVATNVMICAEYQLLSGSASLTCDGAYSAGVEWLAHAAAFNQT